MSGMAMLAPTIPGRYATLATWSGAWSFLTCSRRVSSTKIRPGTRIPGLYPFGMRTQFGSIRSSGPEYGCFCMGHSWALDVDDHLGDPNVALALDAQAVVGNRLHLVG